MTVQRWTGIVSAHESGGFVAVGDYLELQAEVAELDEKLEYMTLAFGEWITKTQWVQDTIQPGELGMHRADVIKSRFDSLNAKLAEAEKRLHMLLMLVLAKDVTALDVCKVVSERAMEIIQLLKGTP